MIVLLGVEDGQLHSYKGFRKCFNTANEADTYLQLMCAKIDIKEIKRYAIYIGDETTSLDAVMHLHNWKGTDYKFRDDSTKIKTVDIAQIKLYYDLEYQRQQQKQALHRAERTNEINNMDASALEYHRQLFQQNNVNLY